MKFCTKCTTNKPKVEFNKRSDGPGLRAHCKVCSSKDNCARSMVKRPRRKTKRAPEVQKEYSLLSYKKYRAKPENKAKQAECEARRRAKKLNATPKWLSKEQLAHITCYYESAKYFSQLFGQQMDVDHIVPLKGKNVSGLHVPWNLQLMTHTGNQLKSNKYEY